MTDPIRRREEQLADEILANEALTADLDDAAGQALLEWALSAAHWIAARTAGLDQTAASQLMDEAQAAVRRLMRAVRGLAVRWETLDDGERQAYVDQMAEQAPLVYGPGYVPRAQEEVKLNRAPGRTSEVEPAALISELRMVFEGRGAKPGSDRGQEPGAESDRAYV